MSNHRSSGVLLKEKIPEIMQQWEEKIRQNVASTQPMESLVLRDAMPRFLASLSTVLSTEGKTQAQVDIDAAEILNASQEHGRSRAGISFYLMPQVITEYQIMRRTIFQFLEEEGTLSQRDRDIIVSFTEDAVNVAATTFANVIKEAQDQFMASVAHDLKSPLSAVRAMAEISIAKLGNAVKKGNISSLQNIQEEVIPFLQSRQIKAIDRLNGLIEKILDTTKIHSGEPLDLHLEECNLKMLILDIANDQKLVHGDCIYVNAEKPIIGMWDTDFLHRCIENVVENALKYRSAGTPVTINLSQKGEIAVIEVHNQGAPIPIEDQANLFNLHWRSKTAKLKNRGWGFGLALLAESSRPITVRFALRVLKVKAQPLF